jgi:hypothetical protein
VLIRISSNSWELAGFTYSYSSADCDPDVIISYNFHEEVISLAEALPGVNLGPWTLRPLVSRHFARTSLVLHGSFKLSSIFVILPLYFPLEWLR